MSVDAGRHFFDEEVVKLLSDADIGTKTFLNLVRNFVQAFEDNSLTVESKIMKVHYCKRLLKFLEPF